MSSNDRLVIYPGKGIGPIQLGMHPQRVVSVFREKQVYESWMGGNLNDAILFHGMCLHFDECNSAGPLPSARLSWMRIHQREDAYLFDRLLTEWTKDSIYDWLDAEGYSPEILANGDILTKKPYLELSFDSSENLWLETA